MAETGLSLVVSKEMLERLQRADHLITDLATRSEQSKNRVISAFTEMGQRGVGAFINKLNEAQKKIESLNSIKIQGADFSQFTNNATQAIDSVNKLVNAIGKVSKGSAMKTSETSNKTIFSRINEEVPQVIKNIHAVETSLGKITIGGKSYSNSALTKINADIDTAMKKLGEVNKMLQFYAKGEGKKAIGFADTSSYQKEAKELMNVIDLLQRQRQSIIANARLRMQVAQQQEAQANRYNAMERERMERIRANAKLESDLARQRSSAAKRNYEEQYRMYEKMFIEAEKREKKLAQQQAKQDSRNRKKNYEWYVSTQDTYDHAMRVSNRAKTINQELRAIKALEQARGNLSKTDADYTKKLNNLNHAILQHRKNIDNATASSKKFGNAHNGLMATMQRFRTLVGTVFSVSRIVGFVSKLAEVRKEFELQQRSLQALLQNKDEADKLWQKTIDLAVRSPFKVKELVTYTKQLAAYRIESDKLYETNKMLADISAGLGVDMQRLILAYGQVKAANYLRGTELRQFSEAGVNILGELAEYFSELEGRAISVGDVFEMVSKRMVSFSDVDEVLKRLTSEGGTFYRMQEIQSETLKGMLSNLGDSIDLMLNEIGNAHDSKIKGAVGSVKKLVDGWRDVAFSLKVVMGVLTPFLATSLLIKVANSKFATSLVNIALQSNKVGTGLINLNAWIIKLGKSIGMTTTMATSFAKVLGGLATLGVAGILAGIAIGLTKLITKLTSASREAKRLKEELAGIYNEDTTNLQVQIRGYENLIARLKDVNRGSAEHKELIDAINSRYGEYLGYVVSEATTYDQLKTSIESVNLALTRKAKLNTFEKALAKVYESTNDVIMDSEKYVRDNIGKLFTTRDKDALSITPDTEEIDQIFNAIDEKMTELGRELSSIEVRDIVQDVLGILVAFNTSAKEAKGFMDAIDSRYEAIIKRKKKELEINEQINRIYKDDANSASEAQKAFEKLAKEEQDALKAASTKPKWEQEDIKRYFAEQRIDLQVKYEGLDESVAEARKKAIRDLDVTINDINRQIEDSTNKLGEKYANLIYITPDQAETGLSSIAESTAEAYKTQQEIIKQQNGLKEAGTKYDAQILENAKQAAAAYYYKLQIMGRLDLLEKDQNKEEAKSVKTMNKRISLIKEIRKTYLDTEKVFGDDAVEQVVNAYADTFKEAFENTGIELSGSIIDTSKLTQLQKEGQEAGQTFSEEMLKKMEDVTGSDTYIRTVSDNIREKLKLDEGFVGYIYSDKDKAKVKKQIKTLDELYEYFDKTTGKAKKRKGKGTPTIGYGHALQTLDEAKKYLGITLNQADAEELLTKDIEKRVKPLNNLLDKYKELIVTQEQYDVLFNNFYQGGLPKAFKRAFSKDTSELEEYIQKLDSDLSQMGSSFAQEWGDNWMDEFRKLKTGSERLAKVLEISAVTTVDMGGHIDPDLFVGMKNRSRERAAQFRGDLEIVKLLEQASINVSQIDFTNVQGVIDVLESLRPLAIKEGKEVEAVLSKAISEFKAEVGVDVKVKKDKQLLEDIERMFNGYELSLELQKLNIPPDLAKSLFNVDTITLPELKTNILELKPQFKGSDMLSEWSKIIEKLDELEANQQEENAKRFVKFLSKSLDETKVILEQKGIDVAFAKKLFDEGKINAQRFGEVVKNITEQANRDISKVNLDKFKESPEYIQAMGNMFAYSAQEVRKLIYLLQAKVAANAHLFSADEAEAYQKAIQNAREALDDKERSFFRWEDFAKVGDILETEKELENAKRYNITLEEQEKQKLEELSTLQEKLLALQIARAALNARQKNTDDIDGQISEKQDEIIFVQQLITSIKNNQKSTSLVIDSLATKMQGLVGKTGSAVAIIDAIIHGINATVQGVNEIYGEIGSVIESFGKETDFSTGFGKGAMVMDTFAKSSQAVTQAWVASKNGDIVGTIVNVVKSVTEIIKGINAYHDAGLEVSIQGQVEEVERLEKAYDDLAKSIEKAYSISSFERANDAAMKNLRDRIDATEKMIQFEEDKKATDKQRIDEWKDEVESMRDSLRELEGDRVEALGGFGSEDAYKDAAQNFVNAWLDAYKEASNGLDGLNEQFDTFFEDMLTRQLLMRGVDKFLQPFFEQFDSMFDKNGLGGGLATDEELQGIKDMWSDISPKLNDFLSGLVDSLGVANELSSGSLSGLQKGIQGITESQADILASYLNSIRFFVADNNSKLSSFLETFTSSDTLNPILFELRSQGEMIRTIRDMISSVIYQGHPTYGGSFLKVSL